MYFFTKNFYKFNISCIFLQKNFYEFNFLIIFLPKTFINLIFNIFQKELIINTC